ncbi:MAG: polyisoprenoid-binding protein [Verrucomicrobia bacterium]|nr:MAG: polyisoprenoid-binding protein [Verrucomicrobiota bacterium]
MKSLLLFLLGAACLPVVAQTSWQLDKTHTNIRFSVTHMTISQVDGKFNDFTGSVTSHSDDFAGSEVSFTAQIASIDTDSERRDGHLKSDDFFNAEAYPELKMTGKIEKSGDKYTLVGEFTIRDVTKPIVFDVEYFGQISGKRGKKAGFKITGTIDRFDYNLKWDNALQDGGLVVSKEIGITCNVELNEVTGG